MGVAHDQVTNQPMMGRVNFWADYRELPPALVRYLVAVSVAGPGLALLWLLLAPASDRPERWLNLVTLTVLACLAERFPIHLTHKTYVNVASAVYVAMLLTMPLDMCGVAALAAAIGAALWRRFTNANPGVAEP